MKSKLIGDMRCRTWIVVPPARAMSLIFLLLSFLPLPLHSDIGDIVIDIDHSVGSNKYWGYDATLNRFHGAFAGLFLYDGDGNLINSGPLTTPQSTELFATGGAGMAVVSPDIWLLINSTNRTMTKWQLGEDGEGDLIITRIQDYDLTSVLDVGQNQRPMGIDTELDGTIWIAHSGFPDFGLVHVSADASAVLGRVTQNDLARLTGITGLFWRDEYVAVDKLNGNLTLLLSQASTFWAYYYDPNEKELLGRFPLDDPIGQFKGGNNVMITYHLGVVTKGYSLEPVLLPKVDRIEYDAEGILWLNCSDLGRNDPTAFRIVADWAGGGQGSFVYKKPSNSVETFVQNGDNLEVTFTPSQETDTVNPTTKRLRREVQVINGDGQISELILQDINIGFYSGGVPGVPAGVAAACAPWSYNYEDGGIKYAASLAMPYQPIKSSVQFVEGVPWLGGKRFGIEDAQLVGEMVIQSKGQGSATLTGGGKVIVGPGFIGFKAGGGALTELKDTGLEFVDGRGIFGISGGIKEEAGITDAFPALAPLKQAAYIGRIFTWLDKKAKLGAEIRVEANQATRLATHPVTKDFAFAGEYGGVLALAVTATLELWEGLAQFQAYGEGQVQLNWASKEPDYQLKFENFTLRVAAGFSMTLYGIKRFGEVVHVFSTMSGGGGGGLAGTQGPRQWTIPVSDSGWQYAYPSDAGEGSGGWPYEPKLANANPFAAFQQPAEGAPPTPIDQAMPVISGVAGDAIPRTAMGPGGTMMIVWAQPIQGRPPTQATDIWFSYFNGSSFTAPAAVNSDSSADFRPQPVYHHSGKWLVAWERVHTPVGTSGDAVADAQTTIERIVPAWAAYDPGAGTWTAPALMQMEGTSYQVSLATGATYDVTMCWLRNTSHELIPEWLDDGETNQTDSTAEFYFARFDGSAFEAPRRAFDFPLIPDFIDFDAWDDGTELWLFYLRMGISDRSDPNYLKGVTISQIHKRAHNAGTNAFTFVSSGFSHFTQSPKLRRMSNGTWVAAWKEYYSPFPQTTDVPSNPAIVLSDATMLNNQAQYKVLFAPDDDARDYTGVGQYDDSRYTGAILEDFRLAEGPNGEPVIVLKEISGGSQNPLLIVDDPNGVTSLGASLTADSALEKNFDLAAGPGGDLILTYFRGDVTKTMANLPIEDGKTTDLLRVTEMPAGNVVVHSHKIVRDLAVDRPVMLGGAAVAGQNIVISADVRSLGDLTATGVTVSFFARQFLDTTTGAAVEGPPMVITENVIVGGDGTVPGGAVIPVEVMWTYPGDGWEAFAVIDPLNTVAEYDESNNEGKAGVLGDIPPLPVVAWMLK